ncbi:conserved hypothetical protein [[Clostridium] ultunense Esp]|uniref:Uncharacterized protein n=1 Tax=[Clostridium] ultunense Esp TaxID=1288971 RepID=M1Z5E0_9FIRM|nr:hypothetical protein [Schnuerera ultunensis]CCQ92984.1 conserved hypothetical protein [[Clostridium] ultunense Esp]SHD76447.1 conserved protein of unknown function [[Clostridium] ultunense Esp]
MDFDNIKEKRSVQEGVHNLVLEISADEYKKDYDDYNRDYALNILERHLENRGDDGRPSDVEISYDGENHMVRIYARVNYLGNDHTIYKFR